MEPIIKVRYKEKFVGLLLLLLACLIPDTLGLFPRCDKTPRDQGTEKFPGDNGFTIQVSGSPRKYRPNQVYTIQLSGQRDDQVAKFQGFLLVAEPALGNTAIQSPTSLGTFQLMTGDAMTKFSHKCSHAVEATSSMNKENITVYWTSPPKGSGCIDFKAMVVERQDVWFMDDGGLTYQMCEDDSPLAEPTIVEPCCACDEAKYEVIFEGIWSRHTHPKDFPNDEWRTMFSTLIGASHSANYTLWEYGRPASPPLQILGEAGVTRRLESEMKRFSNHIRSVVKAQGLQQRSNVVGQTFAVFRVDRIHHLLSVVSKMIPSPDWIVGLSKENLCLPNCSWVDNRVIDLYPWDIATDAGLRYDGPPTPQRPKGVIQRITSTDPHSDESPFYDATGAPMKPAARIHLIKQREYFKTCPDGMQRPGMGQFSPLNPSWTSPDMNFGGGGGGNGGAATSYFYGTGIGEPVPEETYDDPYSNQDSRYGASNGYEAPTYDYNAAMPIPTMPYEASEPMEYSMGDPCMTTEWSEWSECSATCDSGSQSRMKDYLDRESALMSGCNVELFEKQPCEYLPRCEVRSYAGSFNPFEVDQMSGFSTPWLERGLKSESQLSYAYDGSRQIPEYNQNTQGRPYGAQNNQPRYSNQGYTNDNPLPYGNSYTYDGSMSSLRRAEELPQSQKLNAPLLRDAAAQCEVSQWGDWSDCSSKCDSGSRTRNRRYLYPEESSDCTIDLYEVNPCRGNEADCPPPKEPSQGVSNYYNPPVVNNMGFGGYGNSDDVSEEDPACQTSDWSDWSPCSSKCGSGYQRRTRLYLLPFVPNRSCDVRLYDKQDCYGSDPGCEDYGSFQGTYPEEDQYEKSTNDVIMDLAGKNSVGSLQSYDDSSLPDSPSICTAEMDPGTCHGHAKRWYYDSHSRTCKSFGYTGCYGNRNNFATKQKCIATCMEHSGNQQNQPNQHNQQQQQSNGNSFWTNYNNRYSSDNSYSSSSSTSDDAYSQFPALNLYREPEEPILVNAPADEEIPLRPMTPLSMSEEIDCQVSAWSTWSECSKSCGSGWQTRMREILVNPSTYGRSCPKKMVRKRKCKKMPCPADTKYWYQGSWRHMVDPDDE